jgi:hypothetical protein
MKLDLSINRDGYNEARAKRVLVFLACGGTGIAVGRGIQARLPNHLGIAYRFIDTAIPKGVSSEAFTELRPDYLADDPDPAFLSQIRAHGLSPDEYRSWKIFTGKAGIARLQCLASLAAFARIGELTSRIEGDLRARAAAVGGVAETQVLTCSSLLGGTGAAAARVAGVASRMIEGLAPEQRWIHVCVTSRVLPPSYRVRRTLALEHRQLLELASLMRPGAALKLPNRHAPVLRPGPDLLILLDASAECPRTLDEATDELAATIWNLVTV